MNVITQLRDAWQQRPQTIDMTGRTVLITGGSRGLGLELAREYGARGARVAIAARDEAELQLAARDLEARGIATATVVCDVTKPESVAAMVASAVERFGRIDVLVNNAGIIEVGPREAMTGRDYERALATHFWGPYRAVEAVLPHMRARRFGRIVNIASVGGRISVPHLLPYSVSKFALAGFSEGLRAELGRDGIAVTTVYPGLMRTGSPEQATFKARHRSEYAWFVTADSLPFLSVDVTEAARAIVRATETGAASLVISIPAKVAILARALVPAAVFAALGITARLLPAFGGIGTKARKGSASHSNVAPSLPTAPSDARAVTQNELLST